MVFVTNDAGCMMCLTHRLNKDGYLRKRWAQGFEMFHRFIFRAHGGTIPAGHEIHHTCDNRACCNPEHLEVLDRNTHLVHTNSTRYLERYTKAKEFWLKHKPTGTKLGELFGVTFSSACGWVREWKKATCP